VSASYSANMRKLMKYSFVQYYNNDACAAASLFNNGQLVSAKDATAGWLSWLQANSFNKNIQLFLGLPGSPGAVPNHPDHYIDRDEAKQLIQEMACTRPYSSSFGGVMLFDATFSVTNDAPDLNGESYAANIKQIFGEISCAKPPQTTTTSTTTSTTTTTVSGHPSMWAPVANDIRRQHLRPLQQ
jgi:chitinase